MKKDSATLNTLADDLALICAEGLSGTIFCYSSSKVCNIKVSQGEIVFIHCNRKFDQEALEELRKFDSLRYDFVEFPDKRPIQKSVPDNEAILKQLRAEEIDYTIASPDPSTATNYQTSPRIQSALKQLLTDYIGPMGEVLSEKVFQQTDNLSAAVEKLAKLIPNETDAKAFRKKASQLRE